MWIIGLRETCRALCGHNSSISGDPASEQKSAPCCSGRADAWYHLHLAAVGAALFSVRSYRVGSGATSATGGSSHQPNPSLERSGLLLTFNVHSYCLILMY